MIVSPNITSDATTFKSCKTTNSLTVINANFSIDDSKTCYTFVTQLIDERSQSPPSYSCQWKLIIYI